jgi:hypothetical protein
MATGRPIMLAATNQTTVRVYLHRWTDINPEQHRPRVTCAPLGCEGRGEADHWTDEPRLLRVPEGWRVGESNAGTPELYDEKGEHVSLCRVADHEKAVMVACRRGYWWAALSEDADA